MKYWIISGLTICKYLVEKFDNIKLKYLKISGSNIRQYFWEKIYAGKFPEFWFSKCAISQVATSQVCPYRSPWPPIAARGAWEGLTLSLAAWKIAHMGSFSCENDFGKIPVEENLENLEILRTLNKYFIPLRLYLDRRKLTVILIDYCFYF